MEEVPKETEEPKIKKTEEVAKNMDAKNCHH